ncbi:MAG: flagellar biosynthesis anti-sigma factor FlgM [Desulfitobacteriaceae bacterium]
MKINGTSPVGSIQVTNRIEQIRKKTLSSGNDQVTVSDKAQVYQNLLLRAKELPSIREEKVQEFSAQLADGKFQPDVQKIAEKLLEGFNK